MSARRTTPVRVVPLGGLGEIGKNITVVEDGDDLIVIDCGMTFPREEGLFGVDIVLPDFSYLKANEHRIKAVVITHGHEDHIGAVPYLLQQMHVPAIYATRFTLGLLKSKADEFGVIAATDWIEVVPEKGRIEIGNMELEFIRVSHSIPDCVAVVVHTSQGTIVHTGDLKLDPSPLDGVATELARFAEVGSAGVDLYLADSTQADIPGHTKSELSIAGPLRDIVHRAPGRVIASCFSSHVHRMQQLFDIAEETGRKVCLLGRSMNKNSNIARNLGYMDAEHVELIKPGEIEELPDRKVMVLCTGSQGEPMAAMSRIASGSHQNMRARAEDTFIFSSRTIPGNEVRVHTMMNELSRVGSHIFHGATAPVHVSGHACAEELKTLLQLVRPKNFMPVHGEWRHLRAHAELATSVGVDPASITIGENGCVLELANGVVRKTDEVVPHGQVLVDRDSREEVLGDIMDDRQQLSGDGVVVVVARPDDVGSRIDVMSRGFSEDVSVLERGRLAAEQLLDDIDANGFELPEGLSMEDAQGMDEAELLEDAIEAVVVAAIKKASRRSPLVVPLVLQ